MKNLVIILLLMFSFQSFSEVLEQHADLEGPFSTPQEVTELCIACHEESANDFIKTRHWLWLGDSFEYHGKKIRLGKRNMLNNFCIAVSSNWARCTSCHAGYGWEDDNFDFSDKSNIDCLICHDQTGTYKKFPTKAGLPVSEPTDFNGKTFLAPDYDEIVKNVGRPTVQNCGVCHFYGGGGHGVKAGDMDKSLAEDDMIVDVHMNKYEMSCIDCHTSEKHKIKGALHASAVENTNRLTCENCHDSETFHKDAGVKMGKLIDTHSKSIACQTCHIPKIAVKYPTKTWWDWSKAGDKDRKPIKDEFGMADYDKKKGEFKWNKNYSPEYYWSDETTDYVLQGEAVDVSKTVVFNTSNGDINNPNAKIRPFKVMRGLQPYDKKTKQLLVPNLFGKKGYWKTWNWDQSFKQGMESAGLTYSGEYDWVETEMLWAVDHMVAEKENSLKCKDCHGKDAIIDLEKLGYENPKKRNRRKDKIIN